MGSGEGNVGDVVFLHLLEVANSWQEEAIWSEE